MECLVPGEGGWKADGRGLGRRTLRLSPGKQMSPSPPSYSPLFTNKCLIFPAERLSASWPSPASPGPSPPPAPNIYFQATAIRSHSHDNFKKEKLLTGLKKREGKGSAVSMQAWVTEAFAIYIHNHFFTSTLLELCMGHFVTLRVCGNDAEVQCFGLPCPQGSTLQFQGTPPTTLAADTSCLPLWGRDYELMSWQDQLIN